MANILLLRLEGPLQSWGEHAKWDYRDSAVMPTKSGIVGLLACALGLERGDDRIGALNAAIRVAVRADKPGRMMTDFQTIHADADRGEVICNTEGKPRGDTITTWRSFLQDASFLVAIQAEEALVRQLEAALRAPKWPLYLGRKSCVPSCPVLVRATNEYASLEDAIRREPLRNKKAGQVIFEMDSPDGTGYSRSDERISGARSFVMRRVVKMVIEKEAQPCTSAE